MDENEIEKTRHSAAHILAQAVIRLFPDTKLGIGPVTKSGFYYEFDLPVKISKNQEKSFLEKVQSEIEQIIREELVFNQVFLPRDEAIDMLYQQGQIYKAELVQKIPDTEVSFFRTGNEFIDLCRGPHVTHTGRVHAVRLNKIRYEHWLDQTDRPKLIIIEGIAFASEAELEEYESDQSKLQTRGHQNKALELQLFNLKLEQGTFTHTILNNGVAIIRNIEEILVSKFAELDLQAMSFSNIWKKDALENHPLAETIVPAEVTTLGEDYIINADPFISLIDTWKIQNKNKYNLLPFRGLYFESNRLDIAQDGKTDAVIGLYSSNNIKSIGTFQVLEMEESFNSLKDLLLLAFSVYSKLLPGSFELLTYSNDRNFGGKVNEIASELNITHKRLESISEISEVRLVYTDAFSKDWILSEFAWFGKLNSSIAKYTETENMTIIQTEIVRNMERLLALVVEANDGRMPLAIAAVQVIVVAESEKEENYAKLIKSSLIDAEYRVELIVQKDETPTETEVGALKTPFILTIGGNEVSKNVVCVKRSTGEEWGLMDLEEFLQRLASIS